MRASGAAPPPPPDGSGLEERRGNLERLMNLEMVPTKGNRAECACIFCGGAKVRKCSWCAGRGFRRELKKRTWDELQTDIKAMQANPASANMEDMPKVDVQCTVCTGTKMMRCAYCRGSGVGSYGHAY